MSTGRSRPAESTPLSSRHRHGARSTLATGRLEIPKLVIGPCLPQRDPLSAGLVAIEDDARISVSDG